MDLFIVTIGLMFVSVILWIKYRSVDKQDKTDVELTILGTLNDESLNKENPICKLSFEDSLDLYKLNNGISTYNKAKGKKAFEILNTISRKDALSLHETLKNNRKTQDIAYKFSKAGLKGVEKGSLEIMIDKTTSQKLPTIRNTKTKKITELARGTKAGKPAVILNLTNIVLNSAHMISGADNAIQLKKANNKLDYLVEARKIDKVSELESLFYELQELFNQSQIENKRQLVLEKRNKLRTIRITLRNELNYHLKNIKDPKSNSWLFLQKNLGFDKGKDRRVYEQVTEFENHMRLIDYCFALDFAICSAINESPICLGTEIESFKKTSVMLESKKEYLTGVFPEYKIDAYTEYLSSIPRRYSNYLPQNIVSN